LRVAFYGRVSTEEQADRGNIAGQAEFARKYFELHGADENVDSYELYLDEGVSGAIPLEERPEGSRLLADARAGRIAAIYFYRLDRLARSTQVVLNTYNQLEGLKVSIKSMTEAFDTGTPVGKFFMTLLASIAALERDTILERTQLGKERKAREGCWTSGPPPFGYRIGPDKRLVVHLPEAETVRLIFRLYSEGMSMVPLAQYLNARGIATPTASKGSKRASTGLWHAAHISIILRNTAYMGEYRTMRRSRRGKEQVIIEVPAIVSVGRFKQAGRLLTQNGDAARGSRGRSYLLRGIIFCGHCGLAMVGNRSGRGGRCYYRCTGTVDHGPGKTCSNRQVPAGEIETEVWEDIREYLKNPGSVMEAVKTRLTRDRVDLDPVKAELAKLDQSINDKKIARSRLITLVARCLVTDREAEADLGVLAADLRLLERRREILLSQVMDHQDSRGRAAGLSLVLERLSSLIDGLEPMPEVVRLLVERVEVSAGLQEGKTISRAEVYYRFQPSFSSPRAGGFELSIPGDA